MEAREELAENLRTLMRDRVMNDVTAKHASTYWIDKADDLLDALLAHPDLVIAALGGERMGPERFQPLIFRDDLSAIYRFPVREGCPEARCVLPKHDGDTHRDQDGSQWTYTVREGTD